MIRPKKRVRCSMNAHDPRALGVKGTKQIFMGLVLAVAFMVSQRTSAAAGPLPVDLGSTDHFTILAGAAITSTGGGIITGDVGASPITGAAIGLDPAQVIGTIYAVDAFGPAGSVVDPVLLTAAKGDLTTAYNDAAGRTPVPTGDFLNPGGGNIGGLNLAPGLYKFTSTAYITGADVTLTGGPNDVWIFQIGSDLIEGSGIHVLLAGGAQAKNIFWQVGTSATIGTFAGFKGTIMADQAIVLDTSSTLEGRALAFEAEVTFNGTSASLPENNAPVAVADAYTTAKSTTLNVAAPGVLANDTDADGDTLTAVKVTNPAHGTLTLNADGSFTYAPTASYVGNDSFTYNANDGALDSNVVTVSLSISLFSERFTHPMWWSCWVPVTSSYMPLNRKLKWTVVINVPNNAGSTMTGTVVTDKFSPEMDQVVKGAYTATQGTVVFTYSSDAAHRLQMRWDIGSLLSGATARLSFDIWTKKNTITRREGYSSSGLRTFNAGAALRYGSHVEYVAPTNVMIGNLYGAIAGQVTTSHGNGSPGRTIQAKSSTRTYTAVTNSRGYYKIPRMAAGTYKVRVYGSSIPSKGSTVRRGRIATANFQY